MKPMPKPETGLLKRGRHIVVPLDFSATSMRALDTAIPFARRTGASVILLHVVEKFPIDRLLGRELTRLNTAPVLKQAKVRLNALAARLNKSSGVPVEVEVRFGRPFDQITRGAGGLGASLVVMTTHGHTGLKHVYLGSTAEKLVRHTPCPVLVTRGRGRAGAKAVPAPDKIRTILLATDYSENSLAAFPHAVAWAREFGAALLVVYVVPEHLPASVSHLGVVLAVIQLANEAKKRLPEFVKKHIPSDVQARTRVKTGAPAQELCEIARRRGVDLIIMASHGHTGLKHAALGSVAERVVQRAPCSVLVVRDA
ncbi:MAG: universal stress protein [Verrucomicrobia bacterium]|nr:universal stress protein [Verrucomicrobiota bacterium]